MFAIKDVAACTFINKANNKVFMYTPYLNNMSLNISSENVDAMANGVAKISFPGAKEGEFSISSQVIELKYLAMMLGSDVVDGGNAKISKRVVGTLDSQKKITLTGIKALTGSVSAFAVDRDNITHIEEKTVTVNVSGSNTEVTITNGEVGEKVVVYCLVEAPTKQRIIVTDKSTASTFNVKGVSIAKDEFGAEVLVGLDIKACTPVTNMELSLEAENPSEFSCTFKMLADENGEMLEISLLEDNQAVAFENMIGRAVIEETLKVK